MVNVKFVSLLAVLCVICTVNGNANVIDYRPLENHSDKWLCDNQKPFINNAFTMQFSQAEIRSEIENRQLKCGFKGVWFCMKNCQ